MARMGRYWPYKPIILKQLTVATADSTSSLTSQVQTITTSAVHSVPAFTSTASLINQVQSITTTAALTISGFPSVAALNNQAQTLSSSGTFTSPSAFTSTLDTNNAVQALTATASHSVIVNATSVAALSTVAIAISAHGVQGGIATLGSVVISWNSRIVQTIRWKDRRPADRTTIMQQYRWPARKNSPHRFENVIRRPDGAIIDLSGYTGVDVMVKKQGTDVDTQEAEFGDQSVGEVIYDGYIFDTDGEWSIQFVATDPAGNPVYGEPLRITVARNLDDLAADELPIL